MPTVEITASSVTALQALQLLDDKFASFAIGVCRGEYALWLGSGISRDRVVGLNGVLRKLIEFLRVRVQTGDPACAYRRALDAVLGHATLSLEQWARVNYDADSATWSDINIILQRLLEKYSRVLDVTVVGQPASDFLLWEGVDFIRTFANQEPDAEHLCIAILVAEGAVSELVSANWDGLLEAAAGELGLSTDIFRICVTGSDFRGPAAAARLMKFHGCALRAIENEAFYRPLLIARWSQIVNWAVNDAFIVMREELVSVASRMRTLMVGMSAQDPNIQNLFQLARQRLAWSWENNPPPHVFAEDRIGDDQRTILRTAYGDSYNAHQQTIEDRSCFRAYGKPLLISLFLHVISDKIAELTGVAEAPALQLGERAALRHGVFVLRNAVAASADGDRLDFVRQAVRHLSRTKRMLQQGLIDIEARLPYRAISTRPGHFIRNDPNIMTTGQPEAACALAVLGLGLQDGYWRLALDDPSSRHAGVLRTTSELSSARVMFVANGDVDLRLFHDGVYSEEDSDLIVIHSADVQNRPKRSPAKQLRNGKAGARHFSMGKLMREAQNIGELRTRFREEAGI